MLEGLRSLNSVRELIDTPNRLPCLCEPRSYAFSIRIAALGGGELAVRKGGDKGQGQMPTPDVY